MKEEMIKSDIENKGDEQEIDLLELARKLWDSRKLILKFCLVGLVLGLVVAFSIPKEYTTSIKLAPEVTSGKMPGGSLGALASFAGISAGSSSAEAVYPQLYPDIVASIPFSVGLFDVKVQDQSGGHNYTVREFLENETSTPWWSSVIGLPFKAIGGLKSLFISSNKEESTTLDAFRLTKEENDIVEALRARVGADVDTKTSVITLSVTMQDPMVSALLADSVAERLKRYVTDYRTNKARQDLDYAEKLNEEAKHDYMEAQQRYASYMDKNQGIVLRSAKIEQEQLQNEAQLAFNLYNQTAQQVQAAKAKVQEITPVYTVVQPSSVPLKPSKPSKMLILVGFVFLAAVAASAWILFGRDIVSQFKSGKHPDSLSDQQKD